MNPPSPFPFGPNIPKGPGYSLRIRAEEEVRSLGAQDNYSHHHNWMEKEVNVSRASSDERGAKRAKAA